MVAELAKSVGNAENTESLGDFRYVSYHNFKIEAALPGAIEELVELNHECLGSI